MKKMNKKGFTLMEMLIVVAIIGILVAIAIPTFSSSLNKAKEATDEANARSVYAQLQIASLLGETVSVSDDGNKKYTVTVAGQSNIYEFSDIATNITITPQNGTTEASVSVTSNNKTFRFPGGASGSGT